MEYSRIFLLKQEKNPVAMDFFQYLEPELDNLPLIGFTWKTISGETASFQVYSTTFS